MIRRSSSWERACWDWCTCRSFSVVCLTVGSRRDFIPVLSGSVARGGVLSSGVGETWEVGEDIFGKGFFCCCCCYVFVVGVVVGGVVMMMVRRLWWINGSEVMFRVRQRTTERRECSVGPDDDDEVRV